jgi:PKD repeat protein
MKKKISLPILFCLMICVAFVSCKKDKTKVDDTPEEVKPTASFTFTQVSPDDPFTFKFENASKDFKETRWEFGDDSTTTEVSPVHTFINTGDYRIRLVSTNGQGYWAQQEVFIKLRPDSILGFQATGVSGGSLTLGLSTPIKANKITWYKGVGDTAKLIKSSETVNVSVKQGVFDAYSVTVETPKGSIVKLDGLVSTLGVVKDIVSKAFFSVNRDNDSGPTSGEGSQKLVDNDIKSKFLQFNYNGEFWAQLDFEDAPLIAGAYTITSGNDAPERDPKNFKLEASNDGINWTALDTRTDETYATRILTKTYIFDNSVAYRLYRLNITQINGAGLIQIGEWRLLQTQ